MASSEGDRNRRNRSRRTAGLGVAVHALLEVGHRPVRERDVVPRLEAQAQAVRPDRALVVACAVRPRPVDDISTDVHERARSTRSSGPRPPPRRARRRRPSKGSARVARRPRSARSPTRAAPPRGPSVRRRAARAPPRWSRRAPSSARTRPASLLRRRRRGPARRSSNRMLQRWPAGGVFLKHRAKPGPLPFCLRGDAARPPSEYPRGTRGGAGDAARPRPLAALGIFTRHPRRGRRRRSTAIARRPRNIHAAPATAPRPAPMAAPRPAPDGGTATKSVGFRSGARYVVVRDRVRRRLRVEIFPAFVAGIVGVLRGGLFERGAGRRFLSALPNRRLGAARGRRGVRRRAGVRFLRRVSHGHARGAAHRRRRRRGVALRFVVFRRDVLVPLGKGSEDVALRQRVVPDPVLHRDAFRLLLARIHRLVRAPVARFASEYARGLIAGRRVFTASRQRACVAGAARPRRGGARRFWPLALA